MKISRRSVLRYSGLTAALLAWQAAKEKAKKPFVATERVKRLLAVLAAVNTVLALALLTVSPVLGYLMPAFEPALLMLAALIAAPMEKHIAGQFMKDAQARLARTSSKSALPAATARRARNSCCATSSP